jgi:predicted lipid-binding transport protein (Tim44 family)
VTRDKDGHVLDGAPDEPHEVIDIWVFARDTRSGDPNWQLVATRTPS